MATETPEQIENSDTNNETNVKDYNELSKDIDNMLKNMLELTRELKVVKKELDKTHGKEIKNCKKKKKSDPNVKSNKEPSGFNKPALVPNEFCKQPWGCAVGDMIPRTQLTKMVYDYIKDNELQNPDDKRIIHPDSNVKELFHLDEGINLEFKTFQTYMAKLYKKNKSLNEEETVPEKKVEPVKPAGKPKRGKKSKA